MSKFIDQSKKLDETIDHQLGEIEQVLGQMLGE